MKHNDSTPITKMMTRKLEETFKTLPFSDTLNFIDNICNSSKIIFLSSVCSAIKHSLFNKEMDLFDKNPSMTYIDLAKVKELYALEKQLEEISRTLFNISKRETEEKYICNCSVPSIPVGFIHMNHVKCEKCGKLLNYQKKSTDI
jgi:hypothetical protein